MGGIDGSAVIDGRNQRAIDVLREQIDSGAKRLGIFYGAAHMPDMEGRLIQQLELTRHRVNWVDAWILD